MKYICIDVKVHLKQTIPTTLFPLGKIPQRSNSFPIFMTKPYYNKKLCRKNKYYFMTI